MFHNTVENGIKSLIGDFKNPGMDALSGRWHRWAHGHDVLDIIRDIPAKSTAQTKDAIGHLATDLFTKDGLPIPGFSKGMLGQKMVPILEDLGITNPTKWLNMNGFDHLFGGLSLLESGGDFHTALTAEMGTDFTLETAWDTFGEGSVEIAAGVATANPALVASGAIEWVSGGILLYKDLNATLYEKLLHNLPSHAEMLSSLGFYLFVHSIRNLLAYNKGLISKNEISSRLISDVTISLGSFVVTKTLIASFALGSGMFIPVLIGAGSTLLFREVFNLLFLDNRNKIPTHLLWKNPVSEWETPLNTSVFKLDSAWQEQPLPSEGVFNRPLFEIDPLWNK